MKVRGVRQCFCGLSGCRLTLALADQRRECSASVSRMEELEKALERRNHRIHELEQEVLSCSKDHKHTAVTFKTDTNTSTSSKDVDKVTTISPEDSFDETLP